MRIARLGIAIMLSAGGLCVLGVTTKSFACSDPAGGLLLGNGAVQGGVGCQGDKGHTGKDGTKWTKGGQPPLCVWVPEPDYPAMPPEPIAGPDGQWYAKFCKFGQFKTLAEFEAEMATWDETMSIARGELMKRAGIEYQFFKTPPPARPTAEQVMYWVAGNIPFPDTHVAVSPKATRNAVNFPTWIWLTDGNGKYNPAAYAVKSKQIQLFGYGLRWQIVPKIDIDPGDRGTPPSCAGIGVPWTESADESAACTVTYAKSGNYTLTATVRWTVQWWLFG
ncbi:hypothetical protein, partial [Kribbella catacumbae]|uniref:hypothetical protein n=1 Tax=Kribbella catacumbae TaxID=460086 RepID=UPI00192AB217